MSCPRVHTWLALVLILLGVSCAARAETVNLGAALSGAPSTGFDWAVVGSTAPVLDLSERTYTTGGTALGAAGIVTYRFRATAEGSTHLVIRYARSWESVPPERTFELTVRVRPS